MRKLRGAGGTNTTAAQDEANSNPQHTALGLMHLKKLFSEYTHPSHPLTDKERDDKLYNMLPLFCKVFSNSPCTDMSEKFRDMSAFCHQVSRLMVSEIRRRASNQSTEAASCAIAHFLEIEGSEEVSNGWMLLSTLNLLAAAADPSLIQMMTSVSLPSTLVKCLYLFFDLPEMTDPDNSQTDCEFTPRERRILLQKIFVQVLVRLCSHASPAEELSRKDDLTLLFSAITSWCPQYNVLWRKSASEVLMTISRHGLTQPVVNYIHRSMSESSKILSTPIKLSSSNTSLIATSFKWREAMIATSTAGCNERHVRGT
ncbi:WD repeat- and FYVE domain-containing protein 4 [Homalodisca vitripennis]|nr:WD repeat- and FYVE domain-containing protein 4 [Homalodisca vitripennis]